jgi:YfiH family protein
VGENDRGRGATTYEDGFAATDGLITGARNLPLALLVADCVPVYLFDPVRGVGGLAHAGRRGTLANLSGLTVQAFVARFDSNPSDMHALIGPSAGPCCYEVSEEIALAFARAKLPVTGRKLDLWDANLRQLRRAGVPDAQIAVAGQCTICDGRFFSYRAGDGAARNMALLMV